MVPCTCKPSAAAGTCLFFMGNIDGEVPSSWHGIRYFEDERVGEQNNK